MTLTEQVARLDERIKNMINQNNKEHSEIKTLLKDQNGKVQKNADSIIDNKTAISKMVGYGMGIAFVLGLAISIVALII